MENFSKYVKDVASGKVDLSPKKEAPDITVYEVYDEDGNKMGHANVKRGDSISAGDEVYVNKSTGEVMKEKKDAFMKDTSASVTLDEKTGNISVKAPEVVVNNENFRKTYDDALKAISANYKINENYKYKLFEGEDPRDSKGWIEFINNDIQQVSDQYLNREEFRNAVEEEHGVRLSDDELVKRSAVAVDYQDATGKTVKVTDDTMQALPTRIKNLNVFNNIEGWDPDNHVVSYKDLMDSWNRGEIWDESAKDSEFLDVYNAVDEYFSNGDFSDTEEYAEMLAFRDFINSKNPDAGFFQGAVDVMKDVGIGVLVGAAEFDVQVLNAAETLANFDKIISGENEEFSFREIGSDKRSGSFVDGFLRPELESWEENWVKDEMRLNKVAGTTFGVFNTVTPILMQMVVGNAIGNAVAAGVSGLFTEAIVGGIDATKIASAGEVAAAVSGAADAAKIANTAEKMAVSTRLGTEAIMKLSGTATRNKMISGAIGILKKATVTAADLSAQTIVDVALSDSHMCRQFLSSDSSDEDKAYVLEQVAGNALGWAGGVVLGKAITGFSKTDIGKVANASLIKGNKFLSAKVGKISDGIKTILHQGDENWAFNKFKKAADKAANNASNATINAAHRAGKRLQVVGTNRVLRQANEAIAKKEIGIFAAESWDDIVKASENYIKDAQELTAEANRFANSIFRADTSALTAKFALDNAEFKSARDGYIDALTNLLKAEDAAGIVSASRKMDLGKEFGVIRAMSGEVNEYTNALYRVRQIGIQMPLTKDGDVVRRMQTELEHYGKIIEDFESSKPTELVEAAKNLESCGRKLSAATQDVKVQFGVMEKAKLIEQRESGYFTEGYLRQQRKKDWDDYLKNGGRLKKSDPRGAQHIEWGGTDDWQDMTVVLFDDINQAAKQIIRKDQTQALQKLGMKIDVAVSGDDVKIVQDISPLVKKSRKEITNAAKKSVFNMSNDVFDKYVTEKKVGEALIRQAEGEVSKAGAVITRGRAGTAKSKPVGEKALKNAVSDMITKEDTEDFIQEFLGKDLMDLNLVEFEDMVSKMPAGMKKKLTRNITDILDEFTEYLPSKSELPKLRTSAYRYATGNDYKNAPKELKRYLSEKSGVALDDLSVTEFMEKMGYEYGTFVDDDVLEAYNRVLSQKQRGLNVDDFKEALRYDIDREIPSTLVYGNYDNIWDSDKFFGEGTIRSHATEEIVNKRLLDKETIYADNVKRLEDLKKKYDLPQIDIDLNEDLDNMLDSIIDDFSKKEDVVRAISAMDGDDDAVEYVLLHEMQSKGMRSKLKGNFEDKASKNFNNILTAGKVDPEKVYKLSKEWGKEAGEWFEEKLLQRYGEVQARLAQKGSDLVDYKDYFGKIDAINKEIRGAMKAPDIVKTYSDAGVEEYIRLSPTVAGMMTAMPPALRRGPFGKVQQAFCKVFRLGTTGGIVPGSLTRQLFRDTQNALIAGDAWMSSRAVENTLVENFGQQIAETFQKELPDVWQTLLTKSDGDIAKATRAAVQQEFARGATNVSSELESNLYNFYRQERFARNADGVYESGVFTGIKDKLNKVNELLEKPNDMREQWLRNRTYRNALLSGMQEGKSLQEARRYAEFIQSEATTNFGRATYHLTNLSETVPYLGSAINGSKSFWRLYSLDPVGVTTRIVGGYVVPTIALMNQTLGDEENRRIYSQIPEYQKDDNLTFVLNGQIFQIPIPQEMSNLVRPVQSMLETMYKVNRKEFNELLLNDMLGFSPINLEGFLNVDADTMLEGNLVSDHLIPGVMKMSSSLMPPLVKSGFMIATGIDPYTGKGIDTSFTEVDPETGESRVMDYNSGTLAQGISKIFGGKVSAPMVQKILKNLVGENFTYWGDFFAGLVEAVSSDDEDKTIGGAFGALVESQIKDVTDSLSVTRYGEESNLAWNRAVSKLYNEKDQLANDIADDVKALQNPNLSDKARKEIKSRVETKKEEYREHVKMAVDNLIKNYNGTFDRNKFGAVISLMSFYDKSTAIEDDESYSSYLNSQSKQAATAAAINSLERMGFPSTDDGSIFGYYDKEYGFSYNTPISILNFQKTSQMQDEIHYASIKEIFKKKNEEGKSLYDRHTEFRDSLDPLYDAAAKDKKVYNEIDKKIIEWDKEVMQELAPYVSQMTPDAALNSETVFDLIENMFEVPSAIEKDKKGRFFSLGNLGNKSDAFKRGLIKSLYGLYDGYKGRYDKINLDELVE